MVRSHRFSISLSVVVSVGLALVLAGCGGSGGGGNTSGGGLTGSVKGSVFQRDRVAGWYNPIDQCRSRRKL